MAEENKGAADPAVTNPDRAKGKKAKKKVQANKQVGKFINGDHMCHILFQKGKKFISPNEDDRTVNVIIEVEVNGEKQYTSAKDDIVVNDEGLVVWNEHLFFEMKNLSPQEAKDTSIKVRVLNRGWLKNELIGLAQYELASIYFREEHKVEHEWVALENPDAENFDEMKGLIKISANVTGPKDNAQKLTPHVGPEPEQMKMFMSPSIKRTFHQLTISIIEGHNMPEFGGFLSSASLEAFFELRYGGGNPLRTDPQTAIDRKVSIFQHFKLPIQTPVLTDRLVIEVYDYNKVHSNIHIGSLILSAKQLITQGASLAPGEGFFVWKQIYGSPADNQGEVADAMNKNPDIASDWKGMVLLHIASEEDDKPKKLVETMDPEIKKLAKEQGYYDFEDYELNVEVGQGVTMPEPDSDYRVQVSIMEHTWSTDLPKETKGEYTRWSQRCSEPLRWQLPKNPHSTFTTPLDQIQEGHMRLEYRVYVYLVYEEEPICFWHGLLSDFQALNAQWKWIQLKPDRTYDQVENDHEAGMVSIKLSIARLASHGNGTIAFKREQAWKKPPPRRIGAYQLRCFIFQCRDLPAADSDGSSDPFIKIFNSTGSDVKTQIIEDNVNPIFMEAKEVGLDFLDYQSYQDAPPIIMDVMDADAGWTTSADFLGRCTIFLKDIENLSDGDTIPTPKWYDIKFGTDANSPACGQVLCSFALFPGDALPTPLDMMPLKMHDMIDQLDYDVYINVLGLRELESMGLIPIQKAFVNFMIKSLTDPKKSGALQNIKTLPSDSGSNPNINSTVKFQVPLPTEELYCPSLSCTVYDQVFLGFSQPVVGTFTIPLGQIMQEGNRTNEKLIAQARDILRKLQGIIAGGRGAAGSLVSENGIQVEVANNNEAASAQVINTAGSDGEIEEVQDEGFDLKGEAMEADEGLKLLGSDMAKSGMKKPLSAVKRDQQAEQRAKVEKDQTAKLQAKQDRKREARELSQTMDNSNNVSLPNYVYDPQLKVYREVLPPSSKLFKAVGFNNQELVKTIMDLMNKIPVSAAQNPEVSRNNSKLASKMRKEMRHNLKNKLAKSTSKSLKKLATQIQDPPADEDASVREAVMLMQQVYDLTNKHYRRYFEDELENDPEIFPKPIFYTAKIQSGQSRGVEKSFFSFGTSSQDESGQESTIRQVGRFKGTIEIVNTEQKRKFEAERGQLLEQIFDTLKELYRAATDTETTFSLESVHTAEDKATFMSDLQKMGVKMPELTTFLEEVAFSGLIKDLLQRQTDAIVHLYLIQGYEFASRDIGSPSDPYLIVRCGETEVNDRDNYQNDEPNPRFNKRLDFNVSLPGAPPLVIEAYDYDLLFGDDLIGKTSIDLDDRFFNPKWQAIDEKPIETRELYHVSSSLNQGMIDMWVDIDPATKSSDCGKVWEIASEPQRDFQVRLAVLKCTGVPMEDWEGTSDVYIKAFISDTDKQETDTHYRCTTGKPSFNYRLLFGLQTPTITPFKLTMQAWDRDLLKSNDLICQWQIDITEIVRDSKITGQPIALNKNYFMESLEKRVTKSGEDPPYEFSTSDRDSNGAPDNTIVMTTYSPADTEKKKPIKIFLDLRVVPASYAEMNKVGAAREEPNVEPLLPPPEGRFKLSLNPFAMLNQMCGAALRRKIWCCICCVVCLVIIYLVFPLLASFVTLFGG